MNSGTCPQCGLADKKPGRLFCSRTCAMKSVRAAGSYKGDANPNWRGGKVAILCDECGTEYESLPSAKSRFCSRACSARWGAKHPSGKPRKKKKMVPIRERFEKLFSKEDSGCWVWHGAQKTSGYGKFSVDGVFKSSHRVAYEIYIGAIPEGKQVLHKCDDRLCVNPSHFFIGTNDDNYKDKMAKMRQDRTLSPKKVKMIRREHKNGATCKDLSGKYGTTAANISHICNGKSWRWLK